MCSCSGNCNCNSSTIPRGPQGNPGTAATIAVGQVTPLPSGSTPTVTNSGSSNAATFNFGIPAGANGTNGAPGTPGTPGINGKNSYTLTEDVFQQPSDGSTELVQVTDYSWISLNQIIFIGNISGTSNIGGYYQVTAKTSPDLITVKKLNWTIPGVTFVPALSNVPGGSLVQSSGTIGATSNEINKVLDESSEDALSFTTNATINNHNWLITNSILTDSQDTVCFEFIIEPYSGNGNFSSVQIFIGGIQVSRFTDSGATLAAEIKFDTDPTTTTPTGYVSSADPALSEDITLIKGVAKITRRSEFTGTYDITYHMYNNYVQSKFGTTGETRMVQKIFHTNGSLSGLPSIDTAGLNIQFGITPNFMTGGQTFGTNLRIFNAYKLKSIL